MLSLLPMGRMAWAQLPLPCATTAPTCNLLWNGSFEQTKDGDCPDRFGGFGNLSRPANLSSANDSIGSTPENVPYSYIFHDLVCHWQDGTDTATADLFNVCSTTARMDVPCNWATGCAVAGSPTTGQATHSGNGYAGIYATGYLLPDYNQRDYREYIGQNMTLTANKRYYVEFHTAIAALSDWSVAKLGVAFAPTTTKYVGSGPIPLTPVVEQTVGTPPGSWTLVNGFFQATGLVGSSRLPGWSSAC